MSLCPVSQQQKNYNISERGWFSDTFRSVSKEEFLQYQQSRSNFSINRIIKSLGVGILGATQVLRFPQVSRVGTQLTFSALTCSLWSQFPRTLAQSTTTNVATPAPTQSAEPQGDEFQINTNTTSDQGSPSIAGLLAGGFVVTWASDGQDGSFQESMDRGTMPKERKLEVNFRSTRIP